MSKEHFPLLPSLQRELSSLGERIKKARLKRNITLELVSKRAGVTRQTVSALENGSSSVSLYVLISVLHALGGLDSEIENILSNDKDGEEIEEILFHTRKRAGRKRK